MSSSLAPKGPAKAAGSAKPAERRPAAPTVPQAAASKSSAKGKETPRTAGSDTPRIVATERTARYTFGIVSASFRHPPQSPANFQVPLTARSQPEVRLPAAHATHPMHIPFGAANRFLSLRFLPSCPNFFCGSLRPHQRARSAESAASEARRT
jgi:hypothetical protein